ncbi:peptide chain release factor 2 [Anopheles sinensis]|uniref:Peptide chain release factor 2 n=1 Tax=Anopheles sinensis TaxID=74873 RepID=A0A084WNV3_ANOSI|nr:peptide chain release factor 2 [Anopheles sinensis]
MREEKTTARVNQYQPSYFFLQETPSSTPFYCEPAAQLEIVPEDLRFEHRRTSGSFDKRFDRQRTRPTFRLLLLLPSVVASSSSPRSGVRYEDQ